MSKFESMTSRSSAVGHGDNIKVLSQAWGDPVTAVNRQDAAGDNIQPAGLWSTAPYIDPADQKAEREAAYIESRKGFEKREENIKPENFAKCSHQGCKAPARRGTDRCRWHPEEID